MVFARERITFSMGLGFSEARLYRNMNVGKD